MLPQCLVPLFCAASTRSSPRLSIRGLKCPPHLRRRRRSPARPGSIRSLIKISSFDHSDETQPSITSERRARLDKASARHPLTWRWLARRPHFRLRLISSDHFDTGLASRQLSLSKLYHPLSSTRRLCFLCLLPPLPALRRLRRWPRGSSSTYLLDAFSRSFYGSDPHPRTPWAWRKRSATE